MNSAARGHPPQWADALWFQWPLPRETSSRVVKEGGEVDAGVDSWRAPQRAADARRDNQTLGNNLLRRPQIGYLPLKEVTRSFSGPIGLMSRSWRGPESCTGRFVSHFLSLRSPLSNHYPPANAFLARLRFFLLSSRLYRLSLSLLSRRRHFRL
jgi:hypothetical protein